MRTLKKALSLVLVLAMVLSLGVSAFAVEKAADFTDYSNVTNKEAVDVLVAINVINGNTDGTFGPSGNFTRAQAATMISYLTLGKTVADALSTGATQFNDVPATHWAAKYIQYCANAGIINGYGDGKFGPDDTLNASQWALMLLGALGYKATNENIGGAGWEIPVTRLAIKAGIATADDLSATFNRDMAAKMTLNTLTALEVTYTGGSNVSINGAQISTGATRQDGTVGVDEFYRNFAKLVFQSNDNGTHTWKLGEVTIGTYTNSTNVTATYTGPVTAGKLYSDGVKASKDGVKVSVNGGEPQDITLNITRGDTKTKNFEDYNGATITLLANKDGEVDTVTVVQPFLAKVDNVYAANATRDAYTKLTVYNTSSTGNVAYVAGDSFAKGDYVLYAPDGAMSNKQDAPAESVLVLEPAVSFVSTVSSYNTTKSTFVADGTTYTYSSAAKVLATDAIDKLDVKDGTTYVFYTDLNGTIIGSKVDTESTSTLNYVYVSKAESTAAADALLNAGNDAFKVRVTYLDGTTAVVDYALHTASADITNTDIKKGDTYFMFNGTRVKLTKDQSSVVPGLYSYSTNANGEITLSKTLKSTGSTPTIAALATSSVVVEKGKAGMTVDGNASFATRNTQLVLAKGSTVTTYNGYTNFPTGTSTYSKTGDIEVVYVYTENSAGVKTVSNILVVGGTAAVDTTPDHYAVFASAGDVTSAGASYNFFVDGEVVNYVLSDATVVAGADLNAKTVYGLTLDDDGKAVVTALSKSKSFEVKAVTADYVSGASDIVYVGDEAYVAYDISATSSDDWTSIDVVIGDTVTVIYKTTTAGVDNIEAVFVTAHTEA